LIIRLIGRVLILWLLKQIVNAMFQHIQFKYCLNYQKKLQRKVTEVPVYFSLDWHINWRMAFCIEWNFSGLKSADVALFSTNTAI